jgi:uncharacterized membrane protein
MTDVTPFWIQPDFIQHIGGKRLVAILLGFQA